MERKCSSNPVLSFEQCVSKFHCVFPDRLADGVYDGKKCFSIGIGLNTFHFPVEQDVTIEFDQWSLLKDINLECLPRYDYDPIRTDKGWYPF